jgi:hypothetical protein
MRRLLPLSQRVTQRKYCTKLTDSGSGVAKQTWQNGTPGDSRGVPLPLLSDPLSHCSSITYSPSNSLAQRSSVALLEFHCKLCLAFAYLSGRMCDVDRSTQFKPLITG